MVFSTKQTSLWHNILESSHYNIKRDPIKCVLDARHLNSNTEPCDESWPIESRAPQWALANKKYKCAIDLLYAYAHTPLDKEILKLTRFLSGDKLFAFIRGFMAL